MTRISLLLHSHKKRRDSLETRTVLLIFSLKREISGVAVQSIHQKTTKSSNFCVENDFEAAVLVILHCYEHGAKTSEAVQKICYRSKRVSQMLLVCYNFLNSQNIATYQSIKTMKNGWLQECLRRR